MAEIRVYIVLHAQTAVTPTNTQWNSVFQNARTKPFLAGIIAAAQAAQNFITVEKRSWGAGNENKFRLVGFEIAANHADDLVALLNQKADDYAITGTLKQKFEGVVQRELQDGALDAGFSAANAAKLVVVASTNNATNETREVAIDAVKAYLQANSSTWYAAE